MRKAVAVLLSLPMALALSTPSTAAIRYHSIKTPKQAEALVRHDPEVAGLRTISAKLVGYGYFSGAQGAKGILAPGASERGSSRVWMVAITAASIRPEFSAPGVLMSDTWEITVIDARTGEATAVTAGPGKLPSYYSQLRSLYRHH